MIAAQDVALVLLAAGRSERFGDIGSKLDEPFLARPLGLHVVVALEAVPFATRIAVTGEAKIDFAGAGYRVVANDDPARGIASSVRLGIAAAAESGAKAALIALADMPRVTATHVFTLLAAYEDAMSVVASSDGVICRHRAYRLLTVSFFFARSLLTRETTSCAPSTVSTESDRPPNQPMPVQRCDAVFLVTFLIYA